MMFMFFNYYPLENISLADFALLFLMLQSLTKGVQIRLKDIRLVSVLVVGLGLLGSLAAGNSYFSFSIYFNNLLRTIFYCFAFVVVSAKIGSGDIKIIKSIRKSFYVLFFVVLLELLLQLVGIYYSYYIPILSRNTSPQFQSFRPSGFFDEPSYLAIYLILGYFMVSQAGCRGIEWRVLVAITVLMSQSFAGLVGLSWVLYTDNILWAKYSRIKILFVLPLVVCFVFLSPQLLHRLQMIWIGADGSAIHRIMGSFEVSKEICQNHLFSGIGLGQFKSWLINSRLNFESHFFMAKIGTGSGINNSFLMVLGISGIAGIMSYIWFLISISRKLNYCVLMLWLSFSWGFVFHPFLFLFYSVINGIKTKE